MLIRKKILPLLLALSLGASALLVGCGTGNAKEDTKNAAENVKDSVENAGDAVKNAGDAVVDGTSDIISKIKDNSMTYNKEDFKKDLEKANVAPSEIKSEEQSFFSVKPDTYVINGQNVSVYEYNEGDKDALENDLRSIKDNGKNINGTATNFKDTPHVYKKGRIVVMYDGNDDGTITALTNILGTPILG